MATEMFTKYNTMIKFAKIKLFYSHNMFDSSRVVYSSNRTIHIGP